MAQNKVSFTWVDKERFVPKVETLLREKGVQKLETDARAVVEEARAWWPHKTGRSYRNLEVVRRGNVVMIKAYTPYTAYIRSRPWDQLISLLRSIGHGR